jgi:hypothetical protein
MFPVARARLTVVVALAVAAVSLAAVDTSPTTSDSADVDTCVHAFGAQMPPAYVNNLFHGPFTVSSTFTSFYDGQDRRCGLNTTITTVDSLEARRFLHNHPVDMHMSFNISTHPQLSPQMSGKKVAHLNSAVCDWPQSSTADPNVAVTCTLSLSSIVPETAESAVCAGAMAIMRVAHPRFGTIKCNTIAFGVDL